MPLNPKLSSYAHTSMVNALAEGGDMVLKSGDGTANIGAIHQSELNRLVEQLHELRKALSPFAEFAKALPPIIEGEHRLTDDGPAFACKSARDPMGPERVITFADLRRAEALLTRLLTEDEQRFISRIERKMAGVSDDCTALNCGRPIPGSEPHHLRGFCSERCEAAALTRKEKFGGY